MGHLQKRINSFAYALAGLRVLVATHVHRVPSRNYRPRVSPSYWQGQGRSRWCCASCGRERGCGWWAAVWEQAYPVSSNYIATVVSAPKPTHPRRRQEALAPR